MDRVDKMSRQELMSHSTRLESRISVLRANAQRSDAFDKPLKEATSEFKQVTDQLRKLDNPTPAPDPEGTAPTLSDAHGAYAPNTETAHKGGVGVNDSNANPEGKAKEVQQAGENPEKHGAAAQGDRPGQAAPASAHAGTQERHETAQPGSGASPSQGASTGHSGAGTGQSGQSGQSTDGGKGSQSGSSKSGDDKGSGSKSK